MLEPRNPRTGANERIASDGEVGHVAASHRGYARGVICSRSPRNFFPRFGSSHRAQRSDSTCDKRDSPSYMTGQADAIGALLLIRHYIVQRKS